MNNLTKKAPPFWFLLAVAIIFLFGFNSLAIKMNTNKEKQKIQNNSVEQAGKEKKKREKSQTQASVNFTGTKFIITNTNDFDWERVDIVINEKYRYEVGGMKAGLTYEVGAGQFTDSKNNRFNPFGVKPAEIRIYVKSPWSDDWYGELN